MIKRLCEAVLYGLVNKRSISNRIGVIGVPFYRGQLRPGVEEAPQILREAGLVKELIKTGNNVRDFGDITCLPQATRHDVLDTIKWLPDLAACCKLLSDKVTEVMGDDRKVLTLGGDHSIAVGTVDGHLRAKGGKVCLLWVDAHADLNTADTTESGNIHGMALSLLAKELSDYWPYLPGLDWQKPQLSLKNVAYIGLRSVDNYERFIIEKHGMHAYGMADIEQYGIHEVTRWALEKINPNKDLSLHVSFDIDCLDSLEAPCTGTPVRGGLNLREALHIMEMAYKTGDLNAVDLVEVNPKLGTPQEMKQTLEAGIHVLKASFGHCRSGVVPDHVKTLPGFYAPHQ